MPVIYYRNPDTGEWVEIGASGPPGRDGPDEVWVGPSQPIEPAAFDLWIDTDGEAVEASFFPLGNLTDVTAPIDTPVGKVLGTTATGQWGPIDPPEGGASALGNLTDVTAPSSTPAGKVLGTTATGQWGPVDQMEVVVSDTEPATPSVGTIWVPEG